MTSTSISLRMPELPVWLRGRGTPTPEPDSTGWQAAITALREEMATDRATHQTALATERAAREQMAAELATTQADLATARAETAAAIKEQKRLQDYADMLYRSIDKWERLSMEQADTIGQLRARLENSERGREAQGQRIGVLEQLVNELPPLRDRVLRAEMIARIWRDDAAGLRRAMEAAGLLPPAAPAIPDVPEAHP